MNGFFCNFENTFRFSQHRHKNVANADSRTLASNRIVYHAESFGLTSVF